MAPPVTGVGAGENWDVTVNPRKNDLDIGDNGAEFDTFNRYRAKSNDDYAQIPVYYMFITAPCLNLEENTRKSMNFADFLYDSKLGKKIMYALSFPAGSGGGEKSPGTQTFIKILTNCCEGFSPSDTSANTVQVGETRFRFKHVYIGGDADSRSAGSFNVEYLEKPGLPITKLHKMWYDYAQAVKKGKVKPYDFIRKERLIDYQVAVYTFALAPDGVTIEYWAKYTGVMCTAVPYSAFAMKPGNYEPVKVSIPYSYVYKEDMEPDILADFNDSAGATTRISSIWEQATLADMEGPTKSWSDAFDTANGVVSDSINAVRSSAKGWWDWLRGNEPPNDKKYTSNIKDEQIPLREDTSWAAKGVRVARITVGGIPRYGLLFDNDPQDNLVEDFN